MVTTLAKATPSTPPLKGGYRALLRNRGFLALWVGQVFSQLADRIVFVAFVALITQVYGAADRYTSYLYVAFTIPAILLTAVAGVFVDRWPRRAVLVGTNLLRAFLVALLPWAAQGAIQGVYALAFAISAVTQFFVPAEGASIPALVPKPQLLAANSLFTTTMMASVIFGFALGDPLISRFSLQSVHWPLIALFLLASLALCAVPRLPVLTSETANSSEDALPLNTTIGGAIMRFFQEVKEGLAYVSNQRMVRRAMFRLAVLFSCIVALCVLFISFAKAFLYADPNVAARKFTYIITSSGIGMVLGAGLVGRFLGHVRRAWLVEGGLAAIGACLLLLISIEAWLPVSYAPIPWLYHHLGLTWTPRILATYGITIMMGIMAACVAIPLQAMIHTLIPEDKRGKVLGVQFTLLSTSSTLPVMLAGLGTERFGVQWTMGTLGALLLLIGVKGLIQRYAAKTFSSADVVDAHW